MASIAQYTDGVTGGSVQLLGYLSMYTISGERVQHSTAVQTLKDGSYKHIGGAFPANAPKDVDVFKRIASNAKRSKVPTDNDDITRNVLVRNVGTSNNTTTKRIVVEDVGKAKKALAYGQHFDVEFNHTSGLVVKRDLTPILLADRQPLTHLSAVQQERHDLAEEVVDEIISDYNAWRGCLNSYAVREWLRAELQRLMATSVKRGVYFVSADQREALDELVRFVNLLPGKSMFHLIPLVDNAKQREMIEAAYETETQTEIDDLMAEIAQTVDSGAKVTKKGREAKVKAVAALNQKMVEYQELLSSTLDTASARLDLLNEIMDEFLEVETKGSKTEPETPTPEPVDEPEDDEADDLADMLADLDDLPDDAH